jgi:hypothetical protein
LPLPKTLKGTILARTYPESGECQLDPERLLMEGSKPQYVDEPRHSSPAGLIIRQREPTNLEMPFDQVDSYLTPTELF